ncbi:MAG: energy transducer TonB [Lentisphaeria bacterium]
MTPQRQGWVCSLLLHGACLLAFFLLGWRMPQAASGPVGLEVLMGEAVPASRGSPPAHAAEEAEEPETAAKSPAAKLSNAESSVKVTAPKKTVESEAEKIARIRKGLKKTSKKQLAAKALAAMNKMERFDAGAIGNSLSGQVRNIGVARFSTQGGGGAGGAQGASYFAAVTAQLHDQWDQPSRAEAGDGRPRVVVSLTIAADGRVTNARVTSASGRAAMDSSVRELLAGLSRLAPPRDFGISSSSLTLVVNFELD